MTPVTLLTTAEVARRLGVTQRTIQRRAHAGHIPYVRKLDGLRGQYLFNPRTIDNLARKAGRP